MNGNEYFNNLRASSFEYAFISKYFHVFKNIIVTIKAIALPTTVEINSPHAPILKNTSVTTLETTVSEADKKSLIPYNPYGI